jgi:hypothetical protein
MVPKSSTDGRDKPHLGPQDFHEGPQAAARFRSAVTHIAALPKSVVPPHKPHKLSSGRKK